MESNWYEKYYRRMLLDFHIHEWNPEFLLQFDAEEFAACVAAGGMKSATIMTNTHTGLCNYPTKVGKQHGAWKGRDAIAEMIEALHKRDIAVILYYCTIYTDWYWEQHPEARIVDADGRSDKLLMGNFGNPRRFSVLCPNNPEYREFVEAQLSELCDRYEFEGVWPDMTFWPTVCFCPACRSRYTDEVGGEIPRTIDWEDPLWVGFQRKRQQWLLEFIHLVTSTIKNRKPEVTVAHQSQTFNHDWLFAPSLEMVDENDWLSADLYGDRNTIGFYAKLFNAVSRRKPFEHLNTWCYPNIHEHVVTRTTEELRANVFAAFSNNGAMSFIDAVDPSGKTHRRNYERVAPIFRELEGYEPLAGGGFCQDIGIYYSFDNVFDQAENGRSLTPPRYCFQPGTPPQGAATHRSAALNLARTLQQWHLPFGVVTKKDLYRLSEYQVITLPHVIMLDEEEADALRTYVETGGSLYASKNTSLITKEGVRRDDFLLSDLFGVSYEGETASILTYLEPAAAASDLFGEFGGRYPMTLHGSQLLLSARKGTEILATITLPYSDPTGTKYASILTDPPGIVTEHSALVLNRVGKGKVLYAAGVLESMDHHSQRDVLARLIRSLCPRPLWFETDAPKCVELTLFDQPEQGRYLLHLLSIQETMPNVPVCGMSIRLCLRGRSPGKLEVAPSGEALEYRIEGPWLEFEVPELKDYLLVCLEYA
jgi:hypothetical protein